MSSEQQYSISEIEQEDTDSTQGNEDNEIKVEGSVFKNVAMERDDSLPPKPPSEVKTLANGVTKQIIKEGHGNCPSQGSTCFLHYRAWTEMTMHKFDDTFQEQRPLELVLGQEKLVQRGLAIGVASMKAGESALFCVGWELGFGEEGNFSFPNVPPKADLIFEVDLIGFEAAKEGGKPRSQMTVEERIDAADRRRAEGNQLFRDDKIEAAIQQYEMALAYMNDDFMFQLFGKYKDLADAVKHPCHLNMAACMLRLNRYEEAIAQCSMVLQENENNVKALYRRGKARAALNRTDEAREDFKKLQKLAPEDKSVVKELRELAEHDKQLYMKQKELYKGIFGPPPPAGSQQKLHWYQALWNWLITSINGSFQVESAQALGLDRSSYLAGKAVRKGHF
ncbi:hypothetical protein L7F22_043449 [Adiantum nelumboides]|nr:hypothetical protein [Adiantum nelumboides]